MSKSSTVTARDRPVPASASASGAVKIHAESFTLESQTRIQILDVTDRVIRAVAASGVSEGVINLFSMHTTCSLLVNEFQPALAADVRAFLERIVAPEEVWKHNDPAHSDCDRLNADSHLRATLLSPSLTLQVSGGEVVLGQWQRVLVVEFDGPQPRSVRIMAMGVK